MCAKDFEVSEKRALFLASEKRTITANLHTWLTVHGNICLALRHPKNRGPSREIAITFVNELGKALVRWGALTESELKAITKLENEEGSPDIGGC